MQREAAKQVRKLFDEQMKRECPAFEKAREQPFTGDVLYRRQLSSGAVGFILLCIMQKDHMFTLEVAWSTDGEFPVDMFCQVPFGVLSKGVPPESPVDGKVRFRVSEFWNPGRDGWWHLAGERPTLQESVKALLETDWENYKPTTFSKEQVDLAVGKASTALREFVNPYFEAMASC